MSTCFVIQPFDKGPYDKRYAQVFKPAIEAAALEAYRVDKDPSSDVPIDSIEKGIRDASVCLADITTDNPNVWYELGFAFACSTPVVMVCATERGGKKYPFDIQHRTVTSYASEAPEDFRNLQEAIATRLKASLAKGATLKQLELSDQVIAPIEGLGEVEMTVLAILAGSVMPSNASYGVWRLQQDAEKAGLTKLDCNLGVRRLLWKKLVANSSEMDNNGYIMDGLTVEDAGWSWIEANESKFILSKGDGRRKTRDTEPPF